MASRQQHNDEGRVVGEKALGRDLTMDELGVVNEVNQRLDQFSHYPDMEFLSRHRKFLHHREGVEYFERRYGVLGKVVAERHILTDCGHIPKAADYYSGKVNKFGGRNVRD